jgi:hypothetical protein
MIIHPSSPKPVKPVPVIVELAVKEVPVVTEAKLGGEYANGVTEFFVSKKSMRLSISVSVLFINRTSNI